MDMQVAHFREWVGDRGSRSLAGHSGTGEWECGYPAWGELCEAVLEFVETVPCADWSAAQTDQLLYAIARDSEDEYLASEIRARNRDAFLHLVVAGLNCSEADARWQLAAELPESGLENEQMELVLEQYMQDRFEYVRRRALMSMARIGARRTEEFALQEWSRDDPAQEWTRMAVLWSLRLIHSIHFESLAAEAEADGGLHLAGYTRRLRRGKFENELQSLCSVVEIILPLGATRCLSRNQEIIRTSMSGASKLITGELFHDRCRDRYRFLKSRQRSRENPSNEL